MIDDLAGWLTAVLDDVERENAPGAPQWAGLTLHRWRCGYTGDAFTVVCNCDGPAIALAGVEADRAILATVLGWPHSYDDNDMWWSCSQAVDYSSGLGDHEPGSGCADTSRAGRPCDCGLENRQLAILGPVTSRHGHRPGWRQEWLPAPPIVPSGWAP